MRRKALGRGILGVLLLAAALLLLYHCPFRYLFGVACPGCGMTRALWHAVFSDFETAFSYHPLFPLLIPAALWIGLQQRGQLRVSARGKSMCLMAFAGLFVFVYVMRLAAGDPVVAPDLENGLLERVWHSLL